MTALRRSVATLALAAMVVGCSGGPAGSAAGSPAAAASLAARPVAASSEPSSPIAATSPATAASPVAAVSVPTPLIGIWTSDVQHTTATSGAWTLKAGPRNLSLRNPKGSDFFTLDPTLVSDHEIVVPASADCPDQTEVTEGRYTYVITGSELVITLVSDSCTDRSGTLTVAPWTKQP